MSIVQKIACQVEKIVDHGDHVYSVTLRPARPVPRFRPGQFLHLALDDYDPAGFWPESRVFSIASSPLLRDRLRITYSVRGRFTARMENELSEGGHVWIQLPFGEFMIDNKTDVVLFAGGTGITAFITFLEGLAPDSQYEVYLAYGARTRALLIYRDLIQKCARSAPFLHVSYFVEIDDGPRPLTEKYGGHDHIGRLSVAAMWSQILRPREAAYYISGPPAMLQAISRNLHGLGIRAEAIKIDAWE